MATHLFRPAMTAALLSSLALGPAWAGDVIFQSRSAAWGAADAVRQGVAGPFTLPVDRGPVAGTPYVASWAAPVRLPRTAPPVLADEPFGRAGGVPGQPADGTWREDGRYIIIHLGGKEVRLLKEPAAQGPGSMPSPTVRTGGTAYGRILNKGQPLANCRIALSPLVKRFTGYTFDNTAEPLRAVTDVRGVYCFESVPAGAYKLSWLPQGSDRWTRRIKMQPDATVRGDAVVSLKDIRSAFQAVN